MASPAVLRASLDALHFSGLTSLARRSLRGQGVIFCLHHVCPGGGRQRGFAPNSKLEIEPLFLEGLIRLVRQRGYETISLMSAVDRLVAGGEKPFAVFTLDDGYKDNRLFGQPVFQKMDCPFTIFVATRIADGTCELWWRILELVIRGNQQVECKLGSDQVSLSCDTEQNKRNTFKTLFLMYEVLDQHEQRLEIRALASRYGIDVDDYCREVAMTWSELREISDNPLCTIGSHTVNHFAVGRMDDVASLSELAGARRIISEKLGKDVVLNAYPYGDEPAATARDFKLAAMAGYKASVTTRKGVVFAGHANHLQALPRIMISGRYQELRYVDALISGLPTALSNRFRKVNVS